MKLLRRHYTFKEISILLNCILQVVPRPKKILNFLLVKISVLFRMKKCLGLPFNLFIEPTARCNYHCIKCDRFCGKYRDDGDVFPDKDMPLKYFSQVIEDIGDTALSIRLWHFGEPFLHPDIIEMIKIAKRKKVIVAISSNFAIPDEKMCRSIIEANLDYLVISFDGATEETYNFYNQSKSFHQVQKNIRTLVNLKKELKSKTPFIDLQFIIMQKNEEEIQQAQTIAKNLGVDKISFIKVDSTNINPNLSDDEKKKLQAIVPQKNEFILNMDQINTISLCKNPWEETIIRYSGTILPCVSDLQHAYSPGQLFNEKEYIPFANFWNNPSYQNFREKVSKHINQIDICYNCTQRDNNTYNRINL